MKPVLVGENNPYGSDPRYALYPEPEHSAGGRLCRKVMGLTPREYIAKFERVNLTAGKWRMVEARVAAQLVMEWHPECLVLCGAKVTKAFGHDFEPFKIITVFDLAAIRRTQVVLLPHPSGLCRTWNEPGSYDRARQCLKTAGVLA